MRQGSVGVCPLANTERRKECPRSREPVTPSVVSTANVGGPHGGEAVVKWILFILSQTTWQS